MLLTVVARTLVNNAHTVGSDCMRLQSWLMPQSPHRLCNDLKCVEWDVNLAQSNPIQSIIRKTR